MKVNEFDRIAITGGPVTGKSRVLEHFKSDGRAIIQTDDVDYSNRTFSEHSQAVVDECQQHERFVVSGVAADRAVRKGLEVDLIIHCPEPQQPLNARQRALKGQIDKRVKSLSEKIPTIIYRSE
jgi:hypothetical protein